MQSINNAMQDVNNLLVEIRNTVAETRNNIENPQKQERPDNTVHRVYMDNNPQQLILTFSNLSNTNNIKE